jgi:hypothetical protein
MNFEARVSGTGGGRCALGRRFWSPADGVRIEPMGRMGPMGRKLRTANRQNPNVQGRSGVPTRAACVSRLATLFAGHPRSGSLCSMGPPHRVDWRRSRPVLMVFLDAVSEKCARSREFIFFQIRVAPMTRGWGPLGVMLPAEPGIRLKHRQ